MARHDFKDDSYDPDEIYTSSQDSHGHSANFRCAVPKQWNGAIHALVQSPEWDYRTVQEFVRDAVYHRLHWTTTVDRSNDPRVRSAVAIATAQLKMNRLAQDRENAEELKTQMQEVFGEAMRAGDGYAARAVISDFEHVIDNEVREPYRSLLLAELRIWEKRLADV